MKEKPLVLFVCTHNAARSQIAEALLRKYAGDRFEVASAGLDPTEVHPLTRQVLAEIGSDTSGLRTKGTKEFLGTGAVRYAIIVCSQEEPRCPRVFPFTLRTLNWAFEDPATPQRSEELQLAKFRRIRDAIDERIRQWLCEARA
jgi:arsenate reductase